MPGPRPHGYLDITPVIAAVFGLASFCDTRGWRAGFKLMDVGIYVVRKGRGNSLTKG